MSGPPKERDREGYSEEEPDGPLAPADGEELPRAFGPYILVATLGRGGMGEVYLAAREGIPGIARRCVVKTLRPGFSDDREYVTRFLDEARIVAQLHHRCICPVFDVGKVGPRHYLAMEYIAGRDLRSLAHRARTRGEPLSLELTLHILSEVLEALDYAHRLADPVSGAPMCVVHRDVSPQNVMVGYEGDVRLIDFGLAASTLKTERTAPNMVMGKVAYMSPEQIYGEALDARADQFAAGVVAYELLMGERFYEGRTPREVYQTAAMGRFRPKRFGQLPAGLREPIHRALSFDREERFDTCAAFRAALVQGRPRADAPTLRALMQSTFAEEIRAERQLQAKVGLASGSGPVVAPTPAAAAAAASSSSSRSSPSSGERRESDTDRAKREVLAAAATVPSRAAGAPAVSAAPVAAVSTSVRVVTRDDAHFDDGTGATHSVPSAKATNAAAAHSRSRALPLLAAAAGFVAVVAVGVGGYRFTMGAERLPSVPDAPSVRDAAPAGAAAPDAIPAPTTTAAAAPVEIDIEAAGALVDDDSEPVMVGADGKRKAPAAGGAARKPPSSPSSPPKGSDGAARDGTTPPPPAPPAPAAPAGAKSAKPAANGLVKDQLQWLRQQCPTRACAKMLLVHASDWMNLPDLKGYKADVARCLASCD